MIVQTGGIYRNIHTDKIVHVGEIRYESKMKVIVTIEDGNWEESLFRQCFVEAEEAAVEG